MATYEIPLKSANQTAQITLPSGTYQLRTLFCDTQDGGWILDISDASGNPLVCGVPLVTGCDLLAQYPELGMGGKLFVTTDGDLGAVPTFSNLGSSSHLWFEF